jgi:hypothetical protein
MVFDAHQASGAAAEPFDVRRVVRSRPRGPEPEDLLTREQIAAALTAAGYPMREKTLATKASRGGGPPYGIFNRRALYRWSAALAWAQAELVSPTTEHAA